MRGKRSSTLEDEWRGGQSNQRKTIGHTILVCLQFLAEALDRIVAMDRCDADNWTVAAGIRRSPSKGARYLQRRDQPTEC